MAYRPQRRKSELRESDNLPLLGPISPKQSKPVEPWSPTKEKFTGQRSEQCQNVKKSMCSNEHLLSLPFFRGQNPSFVSELLGDVEQRVFQPGEYILREGDSGHSMYILNRGDVEIIIGDEVEIQSEKVVAELTDGTIFGEMALLGVSSKRTATVRASNFCDVRVVHRNHFCKILNKYPEEKAFYLKQAERKMKDLNSSKKAMADKTLDKRKALADKIAQKLRAKPRLVVAVPRRRSADNLLGQPLSPTSPMLPSPISPTSPISPLLGQPLSASPMLPRRRSTGSAQAGWSPTSCPGSSSSCKAATCGELPSVSSCRSAGSASSRSWPYKTCPDLPHVDNITTADGFSDSEDSTFMEDENDEKIHRKFKTS